MIEGVSFADYRNKVEIATASVEDFLVKLSSVFGAAFNARRELAPVRTGTAAPPRRDRRESANAGGPHGGGVELVNSARDQLRSDARPPRLITGSDA